MRIFAYEWTCCVENAPASLRREGWAMLHAVLRDFLDSRQIDTVTLVHERFEQLPPGEVHRVRAAKEEPDMFRHLAKGADATLVIAPETDNLLAERAIWVAQVGGQLLGPTTEAILFATDKWLCGESWHQHGVPTPNVRDPQIAGAFPAVLKPRDGVGSQATFLVRDTTELLQCLPQAQAEIDPCYFIVQDYVAGQAASVAFLVGPNACVPLPPASQLHSYDGRFHYLGGVLPLPVLLVERAMRIGRQAVDAIPGLRGYVGVDLVLGDAGDFAIELNPRLTTSYLGLRSLAHDNLALAMVRVALGHDIGNLRWREQTLRFHPDGTLENWPATA